MTINGQNYWLTKHGRQRYLERVNMLASDAEILEHAARGDQGIHFVLEPDRDHPKCLRLITVLNAR